MPKATSHIAPGEPAVTPYLIVKDGAGALDFYKEVFGAVEDFRMPGPDGRVRHAHITIGGSAIMVGEYSKVAANVPDLFPAVSIYLYAADADATLAKAVEHGAKLLVPAGDRPYGNREGGIEDPYGVIWWVATHVEDVPLEEIQRRMAAHAGAA